MYVAGVIATSENEKNEILLLLLIVYHLLDVHGHM